MARKRMSMMLGLLAGGAVAGAAVAWMMRQRRQRWEEYEAERTLEAMAEGGELDETGMIAEEATEPRRTGSDRART